MSDVYIRAEIEMTYRLWCYAAALYGAPRGAICGVSAAFLHGIDLIGAGEPVELLLPTQVRRASAPMVRLIRSPIGRGDVVTESGVRVTSPNRTAFDLARRLTQTDAVVVIDALCFRRVAGLPSIVAFAQTHPGWPGSTRVAPVLDLVEPLSESPMETRLRLVLIDGGLPRPVAQFEVRDSRFIGRLDLAYPEWKIGIEYDGDQHRNPEAFAADLTRQNRLRAAGWTVLRFTARDVYRKPDQICATVRATIPA
jgi:very-short-patch-repair endonuclease